MKSSDTAQIFFEDVRVPRSYIIGEEGKGFLYQMLQFQEERMWGTAGGEYHMFYIHLFLINLHSIILVKIVSEIIIIRCLILSFNVNIS